MEVLRLITLIVLINISTLNADMKTWVNHNVDASYTSTSAGYFKSQTSHNYVGGSASIRFNNAGGVTSFVTATPPGLSIGCEGIDMTFGSFSIMSADEFVKKAKQISQSAAAFAFKMALSTLCKECDTIMQELEAVINMINSLSMDACGVGQALGNYMGKAVGESVRSGDKADWAQAWDKGQDSPTAAINKVIKKTTDFFGGDSSKKDEALLFGSLLKRIITKSPGLSDVWMETLLRALYGDIYGYMKEDKRIFMTIGATLDPYTLLNAFLNGTTDVIYVIKVTDNVDPAYPDIVKEPTTTVFDFLDANAIFMNKGLSGYVEDKIEVIRGKIVARNMLSTTDIAFLNKIRIPLWKAINAEVTAERQGEGGKILSDEIYKYIAYKELVAMFTYFNAKMLEATATLSGGISKVTEQDVIDQIKGMKEIIRKKTVDINNALQKLRTEENIKPTGYMTELIKTVEKDLKTKALSRSYNRGF